jgi:transposase
VVEPALALPSLHASWGEDGEPSLRLEQRSVPKDDPDPKAVSSCYGMYLPELDERTWLRFVEGRPVSGVVTTRLLSWCSQELAEAGKKVLVLVWDNASSWHVSKEVRRWMGEHNRQVKKGEKEGVRIISCLLPKKSPWLNPIEPKWMHGKRRVVEAERLLSAHELAERVCSAFDCPHHEHLSLPEKVA